MKPKELLTYAFHPFLFAAYPVFFLYSRSMKEINFPAITRALVLTLVFAVVIFVVIGLITRNYRKSGIAASVFFLFFLSFGHAFELVQKISDFGGYAGLVTLVPWLLLLGGALFFTFRARGDLLSATKVMNVISICLIVTPVYNIVSFLYFKKTLDYEKLITRSEVKLTPAPEGSPDIYLIILDGYGRGDVLRDLYGYDNEEFLNKLEGKGFFINRKTTTNYSRTLVSLASMLNFRYLDDTALKAKQMKLKIFDRTAYIRMLQDNDIMRNLKRAGYKTAAFRTGYIVMDCTHADMFFDADIVLSQFEEAYYNTTPLAALADLFTSADSYNRERRRRVLYVFDKVGNIGREITPKFVYAHIVIPHPPFVFGPEGEEITPKKKPIMLGTVFMEEGEMSIEEYVDGYIKQLRFANRKTEKMIDDIMRNSATEPIIVIMSDHGPGSRYHREKREKSDLRERFSNFAAYYFPGVEPGEIPDGMTSVNLFRFIFRRYFNADIELLPNRQYFVPATDINSFEDVTELLKLPAGTPSPEDR